MAEETIRRIVAVETDGSVVSLAKLKAEVDENAKAFKDAEKSGEGYDEALVKLKQSQSAYNTAVRLTVKETGQLEGSYNALSAEMSRLKEAWKSTNDVAQKAALGKRIKEINDQLKGMDASIGNFQRNVGDYAEQIKKGLRDVPGYANAIKGPLKDVTDQVGLLGSQPLFGIITLLTPLVVKLVAELKESGKATEALAKAGKALEPVMGFLKGVFESLVDYLGVIIEKVAEFTQGGLFKKIIDGVVGVGNAIMNFVVAPFKGVIAAVKVFKEQGVKGLGDAGRAFLAEMKQGVAFKANYEAGQVMAQTLTAGVKSKKKEVDAAVKEIADEARTELNKNINYGEDEVTRQALEQMRQQAELDKEVLAQIAEDEKQIAAQTKAYYDEIAAAQKAAEEAEKARRDSIVASGQAIEQILGSVAQAYNNEIQAELNAGKISEKEARRRFAFVKAFQLAQAVLNTASGIASVFSAPDNITMVQKWLQAAAVGAQGAAQIATIRRSDIGTGAAASAVQSTMQLATAGASAPQMQTVVPITRVGTNAQDVDELNALQQSQRVYVVYSDIAQAGRQVSVQTDESSF